jgi:hypothetical protein
MSRAGALTALAQRVDASIPSAGGVSPHEFRKVMTTLLRAKGEGAE